MKTIKLKITERLILPVLLPQQGGKIKMTLVVELLKLIEFSSVEISEYGLKDDVNGRVSFNSQFLEKEFEYSLSDALVGILKKASKEADEKGQITVQNIGIIEKIDNL